MQKYGYLTINYEPYRRYILTEKKDYFSMLDMFDQQILQEIKATFGDYTQDELIRYTYQKYPYYAIKSTIADVLLTREELASLKKQIRKYSEPQLFSIGYEGITLETYINKLIINDVHVLCDVRKNAYSQKYGFSKAQLKTACDGVGIQYIHIPELGIESEKRQELKSQKDYDVLFDNYEKTTLKKQ
ncbi:MAG: DUF488 domain-containing protein [Paludibacteraceae bacterium]